MRFTEKAWCNVCRFMTYACKHEPEWPRLPAILELPPPRAMKRRELGLLGFSLKAIAACATAVVEVQPQITFKPRRFVVDPICAPFFDILDLRVGNCTVFATVGQIPCTAFPPPVDESIPLDNIAGMRAVCVGQRLMLMVVNKDGGSMHDFSAMMVGDTID